MDTNTNQDNLQVLVQKQTCIDIAEAIRRKNNETTAKYLLSEMPGKIDEIKTGVEIPDNVGDAYSEDVMVGKGFYSSNAKDSTNSVVRHTGKINLTGTNTVTVNLTTVTNEVNSLARGLAINGFTEEEIDSKLALATAREEDVRAGKTFYSGTGSFYAGSRDLKTGTRRTRFEFVGEVNDPQSGTKNVTVDCTKIDGYESLTKEDFKYVITFVNFGPNSGAGKGSSDFVVENYDATTGICTVCRGGTYHGVHVWTGGELYVAIP